VAKRVIVAALAMTAVLGCQRNKTVVTTKLTGLNLSVIYDPTLQLTALDISGMTSDGKVAFPAGTLPKVARPLTSGMETASILLADTLAGRTLVVRVDGRASGVVVGSEQTSVAVQAGRLVDVSVTLGPPAICGDKMMRPGIEQCDDGNLTAGDGCSPTCRNENAGCDATSCPDGCCQDGVCKPGDTGESCGSGGLACQPCASGGCEKGVCTDCTAASCPNGCCSGSNCYARSVSSCGTGGEACAACDLSKADTCTMLGECRCGGGPACLAGQRCMNGACRCDGMSCPGGCCQGDDCKVAGVANCGVSGAACLVCDSTKANRCGVSGNCECGTGPACVGGQRCASGSCICDATSCPSSCCKNNICQTRSLTTCGDAGSSCALCDTRSDNCSAMGACRCGTGTACAIGQRCLGSTCVCDGTSCPEGCCQNGMCQLGDSANSCGTGGGVCDTCPAGQGCADGRCSGCAASCANGCCSGATCNPTAMTTCGAGGAVCVECDSTTADGCSSTGMCTCGAGPACAPGTRCQNGSCGCGPSSCSKGCCDGASCVATPTFARCGAAGSLCQACDATTADSCTAAGACACGAGAACGPGQRCAGGKCVCDGMSCPTGCCVGNVCRARGLANCGSDGGVCTKCDLTADNCATGMCQCGNGAACAAGSRCVSGVCHCDATSCPTGCCQGNTCHPGTDGAACGSGGGLCQDCGGPCMGGVCSACNPESCPQGCCSGPTCNMGGLMACGGGGAACVTCDPARADMCAMPGGCQCGTNPACGAGTSCVAGTCVCDGASCPNGCCAGNTCMAASPRSCGVGGVACAACSSATADSCDSATGTCRCGAAAACVGGARCVSGSCICDAASCPAGCCASGVCMPNAFPVCGILGSTCKTCDPTVSNNCGTLGSCRCGTGAECSGAERCLDGVCTCAGCLRADGKCVAGNAPVNCGRGGVACTNCAAMGLTCDVPTRSCL